MTSIFAMETTMEVQSATQLNEQKCRPCEGGVEPCSTDFAQRQIAALSGWELSDDGRMISRKWNLKNFERALDFINAAGKIAEQEQHHPDLHLTGYRHVRIDLTTHAIGGLSENDFIVAACCRDPANSASSHNTNVEPKRSRLKRSNMRVESWIVRA